MDHKDHKDQWVQQDLKEQKDCQEEWDHMD